MPNIKVGRTIEVDADLQGARARVLRFAGLSGFRIVLDDGGHQEFARGGLRGEIFASNVRAVPTRLTVDLLEGVGRTLVNATLKASTRFGLFTSVDRAALDDELGVLIEALLDG